MVNVMFADVTILSLRGLSATVVVHTKVVNKLLHVYWKRGARLAQAV
jgi:hypothetical protein